MNRIFVEITAETLLKDLELYNIHLTSSQVDEVIERVSDKHMEEVYGLIYEAVIMEAHLMLLANKNINCDECGGRMLIDKNGVSHHLDQDGNPDYVQDLNHIAYTPLSVEE